MNNGQPQVQTVTTEGQGARKSIRIDMLPALLTVMLATTFIVHGPIPQLPHYHDFADQTTRWAVPHAFDVLSNLGFLLAGLWGVAALVGGRGSAAHPPGWHGQMLFVISLILTSLGSAYYHLAPDNARLLWDRLPIALACAGLLAAFRTETYPATNGKRLTIVLAFAAIISVAWWRVTDQAGNGDLRPYLLIQCLPLLLIPLWQHIGKAPTRDRCMVGAALSLYIAAKVMEVQDHEIDALTGWISGHTLKHLLAALAAALLVFRFDRRVTGGFLRELLDAPITLPPDVGVSND